MASEQHLESQLSEAINMFRCSKDPDIEEFLREKAIQFEDRGWCSVYLLLNNNELSNKNFKIEAYFTLSHKVISLCNSISKSKIKEVKSSNKNNNIHFVLIGQLGKYIYIDNDNKEDNCCSDITSKEILDMAFEVIVKSHDLIPCRCVLVECNDDERVHNIYLNYKFKYLQFDDGHHQFYKPI